MINALDHLEIAGLAGAYEILLGRRAVDGWLQTGNVGLTFGAAGNGLSSMVFSTSDLDEAARLLERRAVPGERLIKHTGDRLVLSREATHGVPIELCERRERAAPSSLAGSDETAAISALDHIVVRTANPERAIALYAGRLGSIFGSTAAIPPGVRGCCSSAAAISWSRSRTTSRRACRTGPIICGA